MTRSVALMLVLLSAVPLLKAEEPKTSTEKLSESEQRLNQTLEWLPYGTETIMAAQGPFRVRKNDPNQTRQTLTELLESWGLGSLHGLRGGRFSKEIEGQTVLLSLEGARHFRSPFSLGLAPYDGCHILIFDDTFAEAGDKLMNAMKAKRVGADRIHKRDQHEILAFDETWEEDRWTIFVARPRPNVLLVGTDRGFVTAVLSLMDGKKRRAELPSLLGLPEWKHVNTKARFWAIRHFDPGNASNDPTTPLTAQRRAANNPDPEAIGLTFSFDPADVSQSAVVRYLSKNKERQTILRRGWRFGDLTDEGDDATKVLIRVPDGVPPPNFDLLLLMSFGHAIYI